MIVRKATIGSRDHGSRMSLWAFWIWICGREPHERLRVGQLPDPRIMRPETAQILIERMTAS